MLLDDGLIGECNDLAGAALEQVFGPGETVGGFFLWGGKVVLEFCFAASH